MKQLLGIYVRLWLVLLVLMMINGGVRDLGYGRWLDPLTAHQLSSLTGCCLILAFAWFADRRWRIPDLKSGLLIGGIWLLLTLVFETGMVLLWLDRDVSDWLSSYQLSHGQLWPLVLMTSFVAPVAVVLARRQR